MRNFRSKHSSYPSRIGWFRLLRKAPYRGLFLLSLLYAACPAAENNRPLRAAIATAHPLATEAGHEILEAGGNAFDAAVAISAVLAVVEPYSSGLGGGGFWLLHRAGDGYEVMVDGRERAPLAAHPDLYLDDQGEVISRLSIEGPLSAGIPGEPAALAHIATEYGRVPLRESLAPAIRIARKGFPIDALYRRMVNWRTPLLLKSDAAGKQFLIQDTVPEEGAPLRQPALAATLETLAEKGREGFYTGAVANMLVEGVRAAGGIWTLDDLKRYRVAERKPVRGSYKGIRITSASPPSSGGIVLISILNMLSRYDLESLPAVSRKHLMVEAMRRAYRDRAEYLGDPDHIKIPVERLIHPYYAEGLARDISLQQATPSLPGKTETGEGKDTTHFSIIDREGNRVAATLSINYPFGSGFVPPGTGVLLNDEMDDFSVKPGAPNIYGLTGGTANSIAPGRRMLSSMTPTFVESDQGVAVLGTPGGSRIITMLLHGILEFAKGAAPDAWVAKPRFHHQYLPDQIQYEPGALTAGELKGLAALGHRLELLERTYGNMQAVFWDRRSGQVHAASDPRGMGAAIVR